MPPERLRILVVDDDEAVTRALARQLGRVDEVTVTNSKAAALEALRSRPFDVVLADFRLIDGLGSDLLVEAAVLQPGARRILTSASELGWKMACRNDSIDGFLPKPWTWRELLHVVIGDVPAWASAN